MRAWPLCWLVLLPFALARPAGAASALILPVPARFGDVPAETYDLATGERLGEAFIRLSRQDDGHVRLEGESGIEGGARTRVLAELEPAGDSAGLRLVRQESRSRDPAGNALGVLEIDHRAGQGRCTPPGPAGEPPATRSIALPADDRVVNVPLNLLFQPLVRGDERELRFQILLCGDGPRIVTAVARVAETRAARADGASLVRIQYELSLPKLLSKIVDQWLPHLSFWFDPRDAGAWIGHEMPLYAKGPTVLVIRDGFSPALLRAQP